MGILQILRLDFRKFRILKFRPWVCGQVHDDRPLALLMSQIYMFIISYDVVSGSEITLCNKNYKPLVAYRFSGNVMTSISTLRA